MKYPFDRSSNDPFIWAKTNSALKETRDAIMAGVYTASELREFCDCAIADVLPIKHDPSKLSWGYDDPNTMASDARCEFFCLPTYLMTQCMIASVLKSPKLMNSQEIRDALHRGLNGCTVRGLLGHGYDAVPVLHENLQMFLEAGYEAFAIRYPQISPEFHAMFRSALSGVKKCYKSGKHVFDWGVNQKDAQEAILKAIHWQIPGDLTCNPGYRLYIAYGSNMDEEQMARRCPDAVLVGVGTLRDHRLAFYRYATVERNPGTDVPIALWRISERDERALNRYEGVPTFYSRRTAEVMLNTGETAEGLIYLMERQRMDPVPEDYYRRLENAYVQLGLSSRVEDVLVPAKSNSQRY